MDLILDPIAAGDTRLGLWISIPHSLAIETVSKAGYDFVILDEQHGGIGHGDLLSAIQTTDLASVPTFVRVASNDPGQIMRALDLGARGVIVPLVNTAKDAARAARATCYPPDGERSFGPVRTHYMAPPPDRAQSLALPRALCFVMIETVEAMENIEQIAATPGVDGLFVGPADLGLSMGMTIAEALSFPAQVLAAVDAVVALCARKKLVAGCPAFGLANGRILMEHGIRFLPLGSDVGLLRRTARSDLDAARSWSPARAEDGRPLG